MACDGDDYGRHSHCSLSAGGCQGYKVASARWANGRKRHNRCARAGTLQSHTLAALCCVCGFSRRQVAALKHVKQSLHPGWSGPSWCVVNRAALGKLFGSAVSTDGGADLYV